MEYENDETIEKMIRNNVPLDLKHIANIYQHHSSINSEILAEIIQKAILTANDANYQTNALFILAMVKLPQYSINNLAIKDSWDISWRINLK